MALAVISRDEARAAGLVRYFTGKPCKRGHIEERHVSNASCMACQRGSYAAHAPARRKSMRQWQENNREAMRAASRAWKAAHPEAARRNQSTRRARLRGAEGPGYTAADINDLKRLQRGRCAHCLVRLGSGFQVDHVQPLAKKGAHARRNLQLLCAPCNQRKGAKDPLDWARERGALL